MSKFILTLFSIAREPAVTEIEFEPVTIVGVRPQPSLKYSDFQFETFDYALIRYDFEDRVESVK